MKPANPDIDRSKMETMLPPCDDARFHLAAIVDSSDDAILSKSLDGTILSWNRGAEKLYGYTAAEIIGQPIALLVPPDRQHELECIFADLKRGILIDSFETVRTQKSGNLVPVSLTISPIKNSDGKVVAASTIARDIRERKITEAALFTAQERAEVTLNSIGDAVISTDASGTVTFINRVAEAIIGLPRVKATGRPIAEILHIRNATSGERVDNLIETSIAQDCVVHLPPNCAVVRPDGSEIPIEDSIAPIHDTEGRPAGAVMIFRDVSATRATALQLAFSAEHDFLTGLPNRMLLNDRISHAIALALRHMKQVGVIFLDLDGFKHINDSLGHPVGDKLLKSIARRLVTSVRASDTVSRQGGDEFIMLLPEMEQAEDVAVAVRKLLKAVSAPHSIDGHDLFVTGSIGVSVYPEDGLDAEVLIQNADTAMYQAKESGRQGYRFFKAAMNVRAVERQSIEQGLRRALERHEFALHYQPKVDMRTGLITGAEALLRWISPTRGWVPPMQFIPVAEDCGLIMPIGRWVLREACEQAQAWIDSGLPAITMAVNVSAREFHDDTFLENLFASIAEIRFDPKLLEVELTETLLMKHADVAASILQSLRAVGIQVSIDDFGTGYSSLGYLRKFPLDSLKIDQSFVRQISAAGEDTAIVTAVIGMARSLKLRVIAEGVETLEELEFLQDHKCDEVQGYYFSRPLVADQFAHLLTSGIPVPSILSWKK